MHEMFVSFWESWFSLKPQSRQVLVWTLEWFYITCEKVSNFTNYTCHIVKVEQKETIELVCDSV